MRSAGTLRVGDRAPDFTLAAANQFAPRTQEYLTFSLRDCITAGPLIVEFLRGTW